MISVHSVRTLIYAYFVELINGSNRIVFKLFFLRVPLRYFAPIAFMLLTFYEKARRIRFNPISKRSPDFATLHPGYID